MQSKNDLSEVHSILLNIAISFHQICLENKIRYYMLGGTMLGAVRHHGFIPWDDDMDFGVMEEDWSRLIEALTARLPEYYRVRSIENTASIFNPSIKIEDARTLIQEIDKKGDNEGIGINIDVFPLNRTSLNKNFFSKNGLIQNLIRLNCCRFLDYSNKPFLKRNLAKIYKMILSPFPKKFLVAMIRKCLIKNKGNCITNYWGAWINKEIVPESVMGTPSKYVFENQIFFGVEKFDEYLRHLYGNYMELPSKDKIHYHIVNWRMRDKECLC